MRTLILSIALLPSIAQAINACGEHDYCPPQGTIHIRVSPQVPSEHLSLCDGATFTIRFSLKQSQPFNIVVESGPEALKPAIAKSFKKWRFGATEKVKESVEVVELMPDCSLKPIGTPWQ